MSTLNLIYGYSFSTIIGSFFIWLVIEKWAWPYICKHHKVKDAKKPYSLTILIGFVERILFTTFVLIQAPSLILLWIAIKVAPQWDRWKDENRVFYNVFLLGNGLSALFGLAGAWISLGNCSILFK